MASTLKKYQQTLFAKRKTSDIQRLAAQYQKQSTGLTGEYETAYSAYQADVAEKMAPYEQQMKKYKEVDTPAYESASASYKKKLDEYNAKLSDIQNNPEVRTPVFQIVGMTGGGGFNIKNLQNGKIGMLPGTAMEDLINQGYQNDGGTLYKVESKPVPTFNDKPPKAPTAPTAPIIGEFDDTQFQQRKEELQTTYQRELSERKSAKLGATRRQSSRPMLQGG